MSFQPARVPRDRLDLFTDWRSEDFFQLRFRDAPGTQQHRPLARKIDDRGFDADFARPALENEIDVRSQVLAHVRRGRGRYEAEAVGRGRGDAFSEALQQFMRDRMRRHAQPHRVLPAGNEVRGLGRALEDERERAGPETLGELFRRRRHLARPGESGLRRCKVHDHRVVRRPALHRVEARERFGTGCVGAQTIDRLGRKRDKAAAPKDLDSSLDFRVFHSPENPASLWWRTASTRTTSSSSKKS